MAPRNSVPRICRRYHYQHDPPPSNPTAFMRELRRGLRVVDKGGFWGKAKSAGWRVLGAYPSFSNNLNDPDKHFVDKSKSRTTFSKKSHAGARTSRLRRLRLPSPAIARSLRTFTSILLGVQTTSLVRRRPRRMASSSFPPARRARQGRDAKRDFPPLRVHFRPHQARRRRVRLRRSHAARGRIVPPPPRRLRRLRRWPAPTSRTPPLASLSRPLPICS